MSNTGAWMARSLLISVAVALVIGIGFYLFFSIHQELNVPPSYAWTLGLIAFIISAIAAMVYFRNRGER